jgi:hypothetical protein
LNKEKEELGSSESSEATGARWVRLWPDDSATFSREAIRLLILFVAQQKPSRGGLRHPAVMQFCSGPLMHFLSGVDKRRISFRMTPGFGHPPDAGYDACATYF